MIAKPKNTNVNNENNWPISEEEGELAIDLFETKDELVLQAAIGGVKASDLDISIANDMITIKGKRDQSEEEKIEEVYYQECFWGPFSRAIILPQEINADKAKATIKNGLLSIRLPKILKTKKKTLEIEEEE
ncbi:MAG: Hsp20/alpha crystallin family protein [Candidatus Paceibacterota bacterium]|jgi:HSP20 family protein|nr:Hsp20/alpha crystallin family protein [Candidatus Paceibacterota bacterium]MDD5545064.1 Hsp20/alpha crystallin family protein [Candidatus Paceibacterota bacterium]